MQFIFEVYDSSLESAYQAKKINDIVKAKSSFTSLNNVRFNLPMQLGSANTNKILLEAINQEIEERSLPKRFLQKRNLRQGEEAVLEVNQTPPVTYRRIDTTQRATVITVQWRETQSLDQLENTRRELVTKTLEKENTEFLTLLNSQLQNIIDFRIQRDRRISLDELQRLVETSAMRLSGYRVQPEVCLIHPDLIDEYTSSIKTISGMTVVTDLSIPLNRVYALARQDQLGIFWERSPLMIESSMNPNIYGTNVAIWQDSAMHVINQSAVQSFQLVQE